MEDKLEDDGPKNAKITLSFPLSAAPLPTSLTSPNHCHGSSSSSSSPHRRRPSSKSSDKGVLWKLDATMDVKHRPFKPPRHDSSPSSSPSSSSSPMTVPAFTRKDIKSPPPLKCSKINSETQIHRSPPRSSSGLLGGCFPGDGWDERQRVTNGTVSPSQTAQILFSLGTPAYPRGEAERKEKLTGRPAGKAGSPHGPSLHPPTLQLPPPLPPPPPPPSEGLTAPPHSSSYSPTNSLKPELICGVCHRLFSSASSLTVHMRLHRGSRGLSCQYCGKVFIHSKRLHSHEASCRLPGLSSGSLRPPLTVKPKEDHFVKVVDGTVIYFCSVCERSYMTLSSLKRHSNVHSWRRKYPCHYCDKVFALAEYRTKHEVWHTGERRYQCIFCWDAFATYYNLKTHQKTIHGINPSLISSEKTANGGYKQKANALKLYRLLPMRSQKRPYKTYSDSLHNGLLLPSAEASALSLPGLGCPLITEASMPSVITYGHTKPSVIVHGTAVSSSVIVHSNQVTSGKSSQAALKAGPRSNKKQRHSADNHRKRSREGSDTRDEGSSRDRREAETGRLVHKTRKSHSKSSISISKQLSASAGSQVREAGSLCQITVRIGEEAIVKRSISETDLRRDKGDCEEEEEEEEEEGRQKSPKPPDRVREYFFRKEVREQDSDNDTEDNLWRPYYSYKPKRKAQPSLSTSPPPAGIKRRPWSNGNAAEWEHFLGGGVKSATETAKYDEDRGGNVRLAGSPSRLSRRALSRHTCPQCYKVCKTSSALTRHIRRHELSSSPERENDESEPKTSQTFSNSLCKDSDKEQIPSALSVSVISYSAQEQQSDALTSQKRENQLSDHLKSDPCEKTKTTELEPSTPERELRPNTSDPTTEIPGSREAKGGGEGAGETEGTKEMIGPNGGDLAKLPFYPDPYQLLYAPHLLAYPYNLAALPVALNMMGPRGDKVEPLPFLPAIFNYALAPPLPFYPTDPGITGVNVKGGEGAKKWRGEYPLIFTPAFFLHIFPVFL
uniref:Zinc finger and BTB domain containing 4 n=1 Tax=Oryzias sinensis TaxID=183150 RepID=A0A8C7WQJ1_9TELE